MPYRAHVGQSSLHKSSNGTAVHRTASTTIATSSLHTGLLTVTWMHVHKDVLISNIYLVLWLLHLYVLKRRSLTALEYSPRDRFDEQLNKHPICLHMHCNSSSA